jgi:hypothetical protein
MKAYLFILLAMLTVVFPPVYGVDEDAPQPGDDDFIGPLPPAEDDPGLLDKISDWFVDTFGDRAGLDLFWFLR